MEFPFSILDRNDFDAVGFGTNAVDYLIRVPEYPRFASKIELSEYSMQAGGEVASSMLGLSRLGLKTAYAGRFGDDPAGKIGLDSLVAETVDSTYCEVIPGAMTQIAFIVIDEHSGERTVIWQRDKKLSYSAAEAPLEAAVRGRVLHLTAHDTAACIAMAKAAKQAGVVVSADIDNVFDGIEKLLPLVDVCIFSAEFPANLVGISNSEEALIELSSRFSCPITGITLGESGSLLYVGGKFIRTPGFQVPGGCADTTGAGDAFRTGFLYGMLAGKNIEESAAAANAVAALNCRGIGARTTLPTLAELGNLLQKA
ncbi:MAG: PfkB family carbohydrate kinase [Pyrinomonadaceae bacterium]